MGKEDKKLKKETKDLEKELERVIAQRKFLNNLKGLLDDINKDADKV